MVENIEKIKRWITFVTVKINKYVYLKLQKNISLFSDGTENSPFFFIQIQGRVLNKLRVQLQLFHGIGTS